MRKLTHAELLERQNVKHSRLPLTVVLNNIRSLYNVGSIFRTADGLGIEKLWLCGITGIPPSTKISKTALGAEKTVSWQFSASAVPCLKKLKQEGYQIVLLEQTAQSIPLEDFVSRTPVCLVVGNEIGGVGEDLLPYCDAAVEIPMNGLKISLNVTVALGIAAFHLREQIEIGGRK